MFEPRNARTWNFTLTYVNWIYRTILSLPTKRNQNDTILISWTYRGQPWLFLLNASQGIDLPSIKLCRK